jgi:hypothetical protein
MHPTAMGALFAFQCFHVLFLALHDWIRLGTFNDVKAVREANPRAANWSLRRSSATLLLRSDSPPAPSTLGEPTGVVVLVALDQPRPFIRRRVARLVDSIPVSPRARPGETR